MNTLTEPKLDELVAEGQLKSYTYQCTEEGMNDNEHLELEFPNGSKIEISTMCSGSNLNTNLWFNH